VWHTQVGHFYTAVGPTTWPADIGENGPPDRPTGYARLPGIIDWDDPKRPWAGFHPVRHRFEGTALASLSTPGASESVLERNDSGYYRPKHAQEWKGLGGNLHKLATVLLNEFAPGEGWVPPSFDPDSPFLQWHLDRNNTLKVARLERLRLIEMCTVISMCSAIAWVSHSNPDSWIDAVLDPKDGPKPDAPFVTFVNSLKHTFVVDSSIQRAGVFVNASAVTFGKFLSAFARAGVPLVLSWGLKSDVVSGSFLRVPACWHITPALMASAKSIASVHLTKPVPDPSDAAAARPPKACLPSLSTSALQIEDSLDKGNAHARHARNFDSRSETFASYWRRRVATRRSIMLSPSLRDEAVLANIATLEEQAKATWKPGDFDTVFM
jgi:hypothetical protein